MSNHLSIPVAQGLRMCHVITTPINRWGTGLYVLENAKTAMALGYQVDIITGWGLLEDRARDLISDQDVPQEIKYLRLTCLKKYISPYHDLKALMTLYRLFRRHKYDVIKTYLAKAGVLGRLAAGLAGVPYVVHTVYGPSFWPTQPFLRRSLYFFLEKLAGSFTTNFIFISRQLQKHYEAHGIGNKANKRIIHVPSEFISSYQALGQTSKEEKNRLRGQWGFKSDDLLVGFVSRMVPSKGHELAIRACHNLRDRYPQLKLILVGGAIWPEEESYFQQLQSLVQELDLADRIFFMGIQKPVAPFYQMFDVYLCPSLYEGVVSATILEAFLVGLPVIAFDLPGSREEGLGEEAIYVPWYDLAALTLALAQCIDNLPNFSPDTSSRRAQAAKILAQWSNEECTKNLKQLYRELALNRLSEINEQKGGR